MTGYMQTLKGPVAAQEVGFTLPHEHLFTDLRGPTVPGYAQADAEQVVRVMKPHLDEAYESGVRALVECSTLGVGRNIGVLKQLSEVTPIHIIAPTGVYREAYIPPSLRQVAAERLAEMWVQELEEGIEGTPIRAGFIKIAMSDDGPTALEVRNLKAAARASRSTGATIASHTIGGELALKEMEILEQQSLNLERFIWVHANAEPRPSYHLEAARRGAYVELDAVGWPGQSQESLVSYTLGLVAAGHADKVLLSHDAGWFDPSQTDGQPPEGGVRGFTALIENFLPALRAAGMGEELIYQITVVNPRRAFAFNSAQRQ